MRIGLLGSSTKICLSVRQRRHYRHVLKAAGEQDATPRTHVREVGLFNTNRARRIRIEEPPIGFLMDTKTRKGEPEGDWPVVGVLSLRGLFKPFFVGAER